jgi:hypothetical protein
MPLGYLSESTFANIWEQEKVGQNLFFSINNLSRLPVSIPKKNVQEGRKSDNGRYRTYVV